MVLILTGLMASLGHADATHEIEHDEDNLRVNTTMQLECDTECPLNLWNMQYTLPDNSEIERIEDSIGEIEDYSVENNVVRASTNSGPPRDEEYVELQYTIRDSSEEVVEGLATFDISFSGVEDQKTTGIVESDDLISGWAAPGFETSYTDDMRFSGDGPASIRLNTGSGNSTDYFESFGQNPGIDMDKAYEIALGTVGHQQSYERFPIVFYSSSDYRTEVSEWSAGEYGGGLIKVKDSDEVKPVVVHETVHGLNHELLDWDRTDSAWFDEGVATHAEDLTRVSLQGHNRTADLFGEEVSFQDNGYIYTLPSRGDRDELWEYYQSDDNPMKHWSPTDGNRDFGYAYSELIIKKYVKEGGEINEIYSKVEPGEEIQTNEEKWSLYEEHLDLRPCERDSREEFEDCLDRINSHEFEVQAASPANETDRLEIEKVEVPERDNFEHETMMEETVKELQMLWQELQVFLQAFIENVEEIGEQI